MTALRTPVLQRWPQWYNSIIPALATKLGILQMLMQKESVMESSTPFPLTKVLRKNLTLLWRIQSLIKMI